MADRTTKIEWVEKNNKQCLKFTFHQRLEVDDAVNTIQKWREAFQSKPDEPIVIIWDCLDMTGYESEARIHWQKALKEMNKQIDSIWLISQSSLIKMGASVMGLFGKLDINTVSSERDITL